ncbi:MAG: LON peptidase substrate-binding domain-containing protein [Gemmatimonadota bacterium]
MAQRLPLFPLNVVLFPGTPLPLLIFEERYRTMLADCMEGDERFGVLPISVDGGPPPPGSVGCVARIHASQLMPDGRSSIMVVGGERFIVDQYLDEPLPYAVGLVTMFEDLDEGQATSDPVNELIRLSRDYMETLHAINDSPPADIEFPDNPRDLSFQISAALELDGEMKQRLLSMRSTAERIRVLLRMLPPLLRDLSARSTIHERARTNGKGTHGKGTHAKGIDTT